jgi:hypothetical protein
MNFPHFRKDLLIISMLRLFPAFCWWDRSMYLEVSRSVYNGNLSQTDKIFDPISFKRESYKSDIKDTLSKLGPGWRTCVLYVLRGTHRSYSGINFIGTIQCGPATDPLACQFHTAAKGHPDVLGWYLTSLVMAMTSLVTPQFIITQIDAPQRPPPHKISLCNSTAPCPMYRAVNCFVPLAFPRYTNSIG